MEINKSAIASQNHFFGGSVVQILNDSSKPSLQVEVIIESEDDSGAGVNADWSVENRDFDEIDTSTPNVLTNSKNHDYKVNDTANAVKQAWKVEIPENSQSFEQENIFSEMNNFSFEGSQQSGIKIEFIDEEDCDDAISIKKEIIDIEENELLQCNICMAIFIDENELFAHNEQEHTEAEIVLFGCNACSATFSEEADMKEHIKAIHGQLNGTYEIKKPQAHRLIDGLEINKKNESEDIGNIQIYQHLIPVDKIDKKKAKKSKFHVYKCKVCLNFIGLTANHGKGDDSDNFMCKKCKEMDTETCLICNKSYKLKSYKVHMEEVHGGGIFPCSECKEVFKCKRYMLKHIKVIHQGGRRVRPVPSKCNICYKVLKDADSLGQHKKNCHNASIVCSICNTKLNSKAYLRKHMRKVHNVRMTFPCDICHKVFKCPQYFNKHKIYHSEESLNCNKCLKRFCTQRYLKQHLLNCKYPVKRKIDEEIEDLNKPFCLI